MDDHRRTGEDEPQEDEEIGRQYTLEAPVEENGPLKVIVVAEE